MNHDIQIGDLIYWKTLTKQLYFVTQITPELQITPMWVNPSHGDPFWWQNMDFTIASSILREEE